MWDAAYKNPAYNKKGRSAREKEADMFSVLELFYNSIWGFRLHRAELKSFPSVRPVAVALGQHALDLHMSVVQAT